MIRILAGAGLLAAAGAGALLLPAPSAQDPGAAGLAPETVTIPAGEYLFRPNGVWQRDGRLADAPAQTRVAEAPLEIMKYPVSRGDYARCVADGACRETVGGEPGLPQTQASWVDATDYARWLSDRTGDTWRLPTDAEWQRAAAEKAAHDAPRPGETQDIGARLAAGYERNIESRRGLTGLAPIDALDENSRGLAGLSGPVWEWTDSCHVNGRLGPDGEVVKADEFCGARVAEGRHQAVIIDFVRDARGGGCAVGLPPDHLGFRLVRER